MGRGWARVRASARRWAWPLLPTIVSSPLLHRAHLAVQRGQGEIVHGVALCSAEDVGTHRIVPQLGVVTEIANGRRDLA